MLAAGGAPIRNAVGALLVLGYYLGILAILPGLARLWWGVPREAARKAQHVAIGLSVFLWLEVFTDWVWAVAAVLLLMLVAFTVLRALGNTRLYARAMTDRGAGGGELRQQLLYLHLYGGQPWSASALAALTAAPAAAVAEAYGHRGADTLAVPLVTGAILLPMTCLLAGFGG